MGWMIWGKREEYGMDAMVYEGSTWDLLLRGKREAYGMNVLG